MNKLLPHVTDIIGFGGLIPDYDRWDPIGLSRAYGLEVDELVRLAAKTGVSFEGGEGRKYDSVRAFCRLRDTAKFKVIHAKKKMRSGWLGFQGELDLLIEWKGERWIVDCKTGGPERWHGVQLAAYDILYSHLRKHPLIYRRAVMEVRPCYARLEPMIDLHDYEEFTALLTHWKWCHK